ncbi:MAG TPA: hypothetical protein VH299_09550 [Solirubrobacterales bacterium]|nr:hypothetical protein [Solirubrobacterales bacterium]
MSIAAWTTIAFVPVVIAFAGGLAVRDRAPNLGAALIAIAIGGLLLISALALATREIFAVALYRYANGSPNTGGFSEADLAEPFSQRGKRD